MYLPRAQVRPVSGLFRSSSRALGFHTNLPAMTRSSIDDKEISKFQEVGSDWWDANSVKGTGPLHAMNPVRVAFIQKCMLENDRLASFPKSFERRPFDGLSFLDVGCGGGILSQALARLGAKVTAIDPGEKNIEAARSAAVNDPDLASIDFDSCSAETLGATGIQFDVVCSLEVVEHASNPAAFIRTLGGLAKPGGSLFLSTMNRSVKSYLLTIVGAEYLTRIVPPGTHDWNKYVTPEEMTNYLQQAGAECKNFSGMVYNPVCNTWILKPQDTDVNYIVHAKLPLLPPQSSPESQQK